MKGKLFFLLFFSLFYFIAFFWYLISYPHIKQCYKYIVVIYCIFIYQEMLKKNVTVAKYDAHIGSQRRSSLTWYLSCIYVLKHDRRGTSAVADLENQVVLKVNAHTSFSI